MDKVTIGLGAAVLIGEGILAKLVIDSHNQIIDCISEAKHTQMNYWYYMGLRKREEAKDYKKRMNEYIKAVNFKRASKTH